MKKDKNLALLFFGIGLLLIFGQSFLADVGFGSVFTDSKSEAGVNFTNWQAPPDGSVNYSFALSTIPAPSGYEYCPYNTPGLPSEAGRYYAISLNGKEIKRQTFSYVPENGLCKPNLGGINQNNAVRVSESILNDGTIKNWAKLRISGITETPELEVYFEPKECLSGGETIGYVEAFEAGTVLRISPQNANETGLKVANPSFCISAPVLKQKAGQTYEQSYTEYKTLIAGGTLTVPAGEVWLIHYRGAPLLSGVLDCSNQNGVWDATNNKCSLAPTFFYVCNGVVTQDKDCVTQVNTSFKCVDEFGVEDPTAKLDLSVSPAVCFKTLTEQEVATQSFNAPINSSPITNDTGQVVGVKWKPGTETIKTLADSNVKVNNGFVITFWVILGGLLILTGFWMFFKGK